MILFTRRKVIRLVATTATVPLAATFAKADGQATNHNIWINDFAFTPANLTIKTGDTVTWINQDNTEHSAWESSTNAFDTGLLSTGQSATLTFASVGSFNYRCRPHGNMRGSITITT